jgi:hypothetical protein
MKELLFVVYRFSHRFARREFSNLRVWLFELSIFENEINSSYEMEDWTVTQFQTGQSKDHSSKKRTT